MLISNPRKIELKKFPSLLKILKTLRTTDTQTHRQLTSKHTADKHFIPRQTERQLLTAIWRKNVHIQDSPSCKTLCGIAHSRKTPKIYFEIIPIFGMFTKIENHE